MSWDLTVMDLPDYVVTVDDIPQDFKGSLLGPRSDLIARILEVVPQANFTDPAWGLIDGPGFSIELDMGKADQVQSFTFHVREGDLAVGVIAEILGYLSLRAVDPQSESGTIFTPKSAIESLETWRAYRDSVVGE
jgi:hypothetical protein